MDVSSITQIFGKAKFVQIGFDGNWESCLSIPVGGELNAHDVNRIRSYVGNNVAFEVFYEHPNGESFIGIRPQMTQYDAKLIEELTLNLLNEQSLSVSRAAQLFQRYFGIETTLFEAVPAHIEMGVVNLWNSFGQVVLWCGKGDAYSLDHLTKNDATRYLQAQPMPIGLEVAFANPHHWLAVPVSKPTTGGSHLLDLKAFTQTIQSLLPQSTVR
ncbi:hypothetical protein [Variovorax sp. PCZ-1]|uniref:hypothetical protein n=1 Tax=Variovorax sp. PCZ-1 TaxID=2835533 RepID=UPI001BCC986F|nr:hypothetical protein [Variovorax sp. PCZ-1]MBS7808208.1 hypothetical protein [Variovorax sp. PCZ-1]